MGEAELGRIDIPTGDGGVKKSFQILHGNRASWMLCVLVVKLFPCWWWPDLVQPLSNYRAI